MIEKTAKPRYQGKVKSLYSTQDEKYLLMRFRDDATAFDGAKKATLARKGLVNNYFNAFIMNKLSVAGIPTHFVEIIDDTSSKVFSLDMIPVECVVRNVATGSLCRRLGVEEGLEFKRRPLFEFFFKNDELHDPLINDYHISALGWASGDEIVQMKQFSFAVNDILLPLFTKAGLILVDFKLEFGRRGGKVILGDEFTPDGCRIWDAETREKLDKDRFRQGLADVIESYEIVAKRLGIELPGLED